MQRARRPTAFGLPADLSECGPPARQPADLSECGPPARQPAGLSERRPTWLGSRTGTVTRADGPTGRWCIAAPVLRASALVPPSHGRARSRRRRSWRPPIQRSGTHPRRRQPGHAPSVPSLFRGGGLHRSRGRGARGNGSSDRHSRPTGRTTGSAAATRPRISGPCAAVPRTRLRACRRPVRAQPACPAPNPGVTGRTRRWIPLASMSSRITRARTTSAWSRVIVRAIQSM